MAMEACNDQGVPMFSINPTIPNETIAGISNLHLKAEEALPELCQLLQAKPQSYERYTARKQRPDRRIPRLFRKFLK